VALLEQAAVDGDKPRIIAILKEIIPAYNPRCNPKTPFPAGSLNCAFRQPFRRRIPLKAHNVSVMIHVKYSLL